MAMNRREARRAAFELLFETEFKSAEAREDIFNLILPIPPEQYQTQVVHQVEKINRILSSIEKSLS